MLIDYSNDDIYIKANKLIGLDKTVMRGSYSKYGRDKACDMDLFEELNKPDFNKFKNYIDKIYNNRKKFYFIKSYFYKPYNKIDMIYKQLPYVNGLIKLKESSNDIIYLLNSLKKSIDDLPIELALDINQNIDIYNKDPSVQNYINVLISVKKYRIPKWSLKELKQGYKQYYDEKYIITDYDFDHFYIEIIYSQNDFNFRISNNIKFNTGIKTVDDTNYLEFNILSMFPDNKLSYYILIKKNVFFLKWLKFNRRLDKSLLFKHNDIVKDIIDFRGIIGPEHNKYCLLSNIIDIHKIKLSKYIKKKNKHNTNKYDKYIDKYTKLINQNEIIFKKGMEQIEKKCEDYFNTLHNYDEYYIKYFRIF